MCGTGKNDAVLRRTNFRNRSRSASRTLDRFGVRTVGQESYTSAAVKEMSSTVWDRYLRIASAWSYASKFCTSGR